MNSNFFYYLIKLFDVEYGALLVSRLVPVCWLDLVGEEHNGLLLLLFLVRLRCRAAKAAIEAAALGSVHQFVSLVGSSHLLGRWRVMP